MGVKKPAKKQYIPNGKLREERERRGWTHKNVADQINLPDSHAVSRWEHGTMPSSYYRQELSRIFGKSLEELGLISIHSSEDEQQSIQAESYAQMPTFFTSFVGREQEITAAYELLMCSPVRLLTLLGTGGIGKTRLGTQVALQMRDHFADGVCFVSLAALGDPAQVIPAIANALGIEGSGTLPFAKQVKTVLREKHLLLFLDNFEHVMTAAPFIEELLGYCPHVKALVTSREPLSLSAEQQYPLSPLSVPNLKQLPVEQLQYAAVTLFIQRAQALQPSFQVTPNNVAAAAEICVHLDGLPLAIELAAARIKLLSPQEILTRISSALHFLKNNYSAAPPRHQTLYQAVKWSYDLLSAQEQWLFRRLSLFLGGVTLKTIETFFSVNCLSKWPPAESVELVESLLNKSLLQLREREGEERRFVMLEIIREYGQECLQVCCELEESQRTYALYFLAQVEEAAYHLKGLQQAMWLQKLEREAENLRAALAWLIERGETELALRFCEAFGKFCGLRGYWSEEQRWLQAALALPQTLESRAIRARVLRRAGHLAYRLRDLGAARAFFAESISSSREIRDEENLVGALSGLGRVLYRQHEMVAAADLLNESVEVARHCENNWVLANALESLGRFFYDQGKTSQARSLLEESVMLARHQVDQESLARILTTLVALKVADGDMAQARTLAQESFVLAQQLGTRPLIALALDSLGEVAFFEGSYEQARQHFKQRIDLARELGDTPTVASRLLKIADIALAQEDPAQAATLVEENLPRLREPGDIPNVMIALSILGDSKRMEGAAAQATTFYREALMLHKEAGDQRTIGRCLIGLIHAMLDLEQAERAAYLLGFTTSWLQTHRSLYQVQRTDYERASERVQALLGEERFAQARCKGYVASLEDVVAALE